MPIVTVKLFPGRSQTVKAFLARAICDAVAELAGTSREGVHTIFDEVAKDDWAIGPRLSSMRDGSAPSHDGPAYVTVSRIRVLPNKREEYIAWRKNSVYPFMASHEGFIASTLLAPANDTDDFLIINKWRSREAQQAYLAKPREAELRIEARELLSQLATEELDGDVVDVLGFAREP